MKCRVVCGACVLSVFCATVGLAQDPPKPLVLSGAPKAVNTDFALPPEVERAGIEGSALLRLVVDDSGHVQDVRIERASHPLLSRALLDAARSWEFTPTFREGRPVSASFTLVVGINHEPLQNLPDRVALYTSGTSADRLRFDIPLDRMVTLPRWNEPTLDQPRLTKAAAAAIGAGWIREHRPAWDVRSTEVELRFVDVAGHGRIWYYVALFSTSAIDAGTTTAEQIDFPLVAIVLLDGTIVEPVSADTP